VSALPVLLASLAAAVAVMGPGLPDRVHQLLPRSAAPVQLRVLSPSMVRGVALLAGGALWVVIGGVVGAGLGLAALLFGPRLLERLDGDASDDSAVAADLPLALDLLAACLVGGATTAAAVRAVAVALPGPCGARLARVGAALGVGWPPAEAWRALGEGPGPAGAAARALTRSAEGGAPVAASVLRVAEDARRESAGRAERAARRAGVLAVGPLGLCFLPAFLLLGIVPAIVGLAGPLLSSI
jgi:pilus assembly protein TadC